MNKDMNLLAAAVESSRDSIMITDADLEQGPFIAYVNPAFTRLTGYQSEEVVGRTPRLLQGDKTDAAVLARLKDSLSAGQPFYGRVVNYRKDGREFMNEWHVEPILDNQGTVTHYVSIQRDISGQCVPEDDLANQNAVLKNEVASLTSLLKKTQQENTRIKDAVAANIKDIVVPFLKKLHRQGQRVDKDKIGRMQEKLSALTFDLGVRTHEGKVALSPREVEIAGMIKTGASSKDISKSLNLSAKTVETHRNRIRRKLGLLNKSVNLTTYLKNRQ